MSNEGSLYIVATPIGNLDDITLRAVSILKSVDVIAAEDTRHSKKLLQHLGINTPMFALHEHNEMQKKSAIIERIQQGESIALISDAGTPLISDPGFLLVREARQAGITVTPIPGASSILAGLSCSGLPTDRFIFEGFIPSKKGDRKKRFESLSAEKRTLIFFEAPHRIESSLQDCADVFGEDRQAVLCRELTKTWETFLTGNLANILSEVKADSNQSRGELVLVIAGQQKTSELDGQSQQLLELLMESLPLKKAASITAQVSGLNKKVLYDAGLALQKKQQ